MANIKPSIDFMRGIEGFISPAHCLNEVVRAWTEYSTIREQEKTKRSEIEAWEKIDLAEIEAKRDFLIGYLDRSFDERTTKFESLFQTVDRAISANDTQQLCLTLHAIVELAKSSPFKDLTDLSTVKAALDDPDHVWEL
jgi:hypothetical protein